MENFEDKFSERLNELIKKLNSIKTLDRLEDRIELLTLGMATVEREQKEMIKYKELNPAFPRKELINIDYLLSDYASKFYNSANKVLDFMYMNPKNAIVALIPVSKKNSFLQLRNLMLRIAARWDIEKMIAVYEEDKEPKERAFPIRKPLLQEAVFFCNRMNATKMGVDIKDDIKPKTIIFAVQPSSGKTFVVNVYSLMSTCLHKIYFNKSGILRMSNNSDNAAGFSRQIMAMIEDKKISEIYPEFKEYFSGDKPTILDRSTAEEWRLAGLDPSIRASYFARGRDSAINGVRIFVALIIDDISDGVAQMNDDEGHKKMYGSYVMDMRSRRDNSDVPILIVGTMFNEFDIQNTLISKEEERGNLVRDNKFPNSRFTPDYSTVIITVDCYDDKDESIAPKLISTKELNDIRDSLKDFEFNLVYRQIRTSREPRIFDYSNLKCYSELPQTLVGSRIAILDPTRRNGGDFFSLPVFDFDTVDGKDAYFIDCIYEQKSLGKTADPRNTFFKKVVKFLIDNNVRILDIENNTSNTIGMLFDDEFKKNGYICKINEFYTAKEKGKMNKNERIIYEEPTITSYIHFPKAGLYAPNHRISQFMGDFTRYDSKMEGSNKKQHDDAPDTVSIFSKRHLYNRTNRLASVTKSFSIEKLFN